MDIAADRPLDGVNLVPYLTGKDKGSPHTALFWQMFDKDHAVVRMGNDKFIDLNKQDKIELYDLSRDKAESNNLAEGSPKSSISCRRYWTLGHLSLSPPVSTRSAPGILLGQPNRKLVVQGEFRRVEVGLHNNAGLVNEPIDLEVQEHLMTIRGNPD